MKSRISKALLAIVALMAAAFVATTFLDTEERAPEFAPPGYRVTEISVPGRDMPVRLHLWYPTNSTAEPTLIGQNALFYGSHVIRDAPALPKALPVVVVSHGSGGNAVQLGWLAGYLASKGMLVAAPDHPRTTSSDSDPFKTPLIWERIADLKAVLDLLQNTPPDGIEADMDRVGSLGFSPGGYTALGLGGVRVTKAAFIAHCQATPAAPDCAWMLAAGVDFTTIDANRYDADHRDPRVTATVAIDPALVRAILTNSLGDLDTQSLIVNLGSAEAIPDGMDASGIAQQLPDARYVAVPGAAHFSFLAECSTLGVIVIGIAGDDNICSDRGLRNRGVIHAELRAAIGGFLVEALQIAN
ncbi:MAG: alpha/beta hydrolase family protein [Paracoccaceae bacterium]